MGNPSCAVFGCNAPKKSRVKMFHLPKNRILQDKWVQFCKRRDKINIANARICEKHFSCDQRKRDLKSELLGIPAPSNFRFLKDDAIPDILSPKELCASHPEEAEEPQPSSGSHSTPRNTGL